MRKYSHKLIDEFERATRLEAWCGALNGRGEHAGIRAEFKFAKKALEDEMRELKLGQKVKLQDLRHKLRQVHARLAELKKES